jgi:RNA polymerase sigma-70 factor, ECF subfamily
VKFLPSPAVANSRRVAGKANSDMFAAVSPDPPAGLRISTSGGGAVPALNASDRRLIEAIQAKDSAGVAPLYSALRASIESALYRVLRDRPPEFEDLMQVTFERVIQTIIAGRFKGRSQLRTWASAIAAHVAIDHMRRRRQEQRLFITMDIDSIDLHVQDVRPERQLEARSEARRVEVILERMKARRATVLLLHDALGYSVPQVAELLGMGDAAAQSTLGRARQEFLRRCTSDLRGQGWKATVTVD